MRDKLADLFSVQGKVAVVTGGSRGIGLMIARGLVMGGARVYVNARGGAACDAAAAELSQTGDCISIPADVSTVGGAELLASTVSSRESRVDILINNAGTTWRAPLEEYSEAGFDQVMNTNLKGAFFVTQQLISLIRNAASAEDPGRIINVGSIEAVLTPTGNNFAYTASKAGVHWLTRHLAQSLVADHIHVNALAPGLFRTSMTESLFEDERVGSDWINRIPDKRLGTWEDAVGAVIYLCSRAGAYVTGAVLPVGGGIDVLTP